MIGDWLKSYLVGEGVARRQSIGVGLSVIEQRAIAALYDGKYDAAILDPFVNEALAWRAENDLRLPRDGSDESRSGRRSR